MRQERYKTGGGAPPTIAFSRQEQKIMSMLSMDINGLMPIQESGLF